jgi:HK97 family phage prohead protease
MPATTHRGGALQFTVPIDGIKFEAARDKGRRVMRGHAAVFNRKSHDLGGFRTVIAPGAFAKILDTSPDVHLLWDHDTRYVLARTKNNTLELREDPYGLHVWAKFAQTQTADELGILMEGGFVDQMSFACDISEDEWTEDEDGEITRTLFDFSGLHDVTICAKGAFPQTDSQMVAAVHDATEALMAARDAGRIKTFTAESGDGLGAEPPTVEGEPHVEVDPGPSASERLAAMKEWANGRYTAADAE